MQTSQVILRATGVGRLYTTHRLLGPLIGSLCIPAHSGRCCRYRSALSLVCGGHTLHDRSRALLRDTKVLWPSGRRLRGDVGSPRIAVAVGGSR
jgi:hypothetical protein